MKKTYKIIKKSILITIFASFVLMSCGNSNSTLNTDFNKTGIDKDYGKENKDIVIFSTNDAYSCYDDYLGYAGIKKYIDKMDRKTNYITLVDTGNFSTGNEIAKNSKGMSSMEIMKKMNYDLIVPGSHEFDYGLDQFFTNMNEFKDKVICCNMLNLKTNELCFNPFVIYKYGDKKVAFVGVTSPEALSLQTDDHVFFDKDGNQLIYFFEDDTGESLYRQVQACVDEAIKDGANKVILLSHLGMEGVTKRWTSTEVISHTKNIDAVIDGHSMEVLENGLLINNKGSFVPLVQAGSKLEYLGAMNIDKDGYAFPAVISKNSIKTKDESMTKFIEEIKNKYSE